MVIGMILKDFMTLCRLIRLPSRCPIPILLIHVMQVQTPIMRKANLSAVMADITYLLVQKCDELYRVLLSNEVLFFGKLGCYPNKVFNIKLKPNAKPLHSKPHAVSNVHLSMFKKKLDHLVKIGVLILVHPYGRLEHSRL
jgi:hypothetical protein